MHMRRAVLAMGVALACTGTAAAEPAKALRPEEPAGPPPGEATAFEEPPPGSAEDQALWRAGVEASRQVTLVRLRASGLQWQARRTDVEGRLAALERSGGAGAERARELLARYRDAASRHYLAFTRQWPVDPTRGCSYQLMHLDGVVRSREHPRKAAQLRVVREELEDCAERARSAAQAMDASNVEMQKLLEEANGLLPPAAPAAPDPAAPGAAARPKGEPR